MFIFLFSLRMSLPLVSIGCNTLQHTETPRNKLLSFSQPGRSRRPSIALFSHLHTFFHISSSLFTYHISFHMYSSFFTYIHLFSQILSSLSIHCITLQHTATHCNTLQHSTTHIEPGRSCRPSQFTASHCDTLQLSSTLQLLQPYRSIHCNTLQHTATYCNSLKHTATHYNSAAHCTNSNALPVYSLNSHSERSDTRVMLVSIGSFS